MGGNMQYEYGSILVDPESDLGVVFSVSVSKKQAVAERYCNEEAGVLLQH